MSGGDTLTTGSPGESPALAPTEADPRGDVALEPGHRIGRHLVLGRLGAGGMGVVFAAYDPELDRKVAIKLMRPGRGADSPARQERLNDEERRHRRVHGKRDLLAVRIELPQGRCESERIMG